MKQIARVLLLVFLLTTIIVPPNKSYAAGEYTTAPRTLNYDPLTSGGALTFEFQVDPMYYSNVFYWVVTPANVSLTAAQIQTEASGSTYPGGSLGYTTTLQQITEENISAGGSYKLHYVFSNYGSLESASLGALTFDTLSFVNDTPILNPPEAGEMSINVSVNAAGTVYGAIYLASATPPAKSDVTNPQGTALTYSQAAFTTPGETKTLNFNTNNLVPNQNYALYLVRQDSFGNYYYKNQAALGPLQIPTTTLTSATYDNGLLSNLADDSVRINFNDPLTDPGEASDYILSVGEGLGQQFTAYNSSLISDTDYTLTNYDSTTHTVKLSITEAGLSKLKALPLNASSVMQIKPAFQNTIRPRALDTNTVDITPFDATVFDAVDTTGLLSAAYNDAGTSATNDDGILLSFDPLGITNAGSATDYQIAIDTHSTTSFSTADITLTDTDYTVSTDNGGVKLNFTAAGLAKLPTTGLSNWQITIVNPNNLTPHITSNSQTAIFSKNYTSANKAQLAQLLVGGVPLVGFASNTYEYSNVAIPYSYGETLNGNYSSLISGISNTGQVIQAVHDPNTGTETITVTAPNMASSTYTVHTTLNPLSLSSITLNNQPLAGFNKFLNAFSMSTQSTQTVPPTLTAIADHPSAVVTVATSGNYPYQYYYTITVTYAGQSKVYTVALYANTTGQDDEKVSKDSSGGNLTTPITSVPVQGITDTDLTTLNALLTQPNAANNTAQFSQSVANVLSNTLNLQDNQALFLSLTKLDDLVGRIAQSMQTSNNQNALLQDVIKTSHVVEQKIQNLNNPQDALTVVEQYLAQLNKVKTTLDSSDLALEQSASNMLQKISDKASTVSLSVPSNQNTVSVDAIAVNQALAKQIEFLGKINTLSDQYFGEESVHQVSTKIILDIKKPDALNQLATTISPEVIQKLDENGVEKIKVQMGNAGMTFNNESLSKQTDLTVDMKFLAQQAVSPDLENNQNSVEFKVYEGQRLVENFDKPIELSFKYEAFGVQPTDNADIGIFRYNTDLQSWNPVGGIVDPQSGEIRVKRTHLSQYTVMKSKKSFSDADNSWAKNEINSLLNKGIVKSSAKFEPQAYLTRGEFSSWIANAYGLQNQGKVLPFKDVNQKNEHYAAIAAVYNQGLISGKSKTKFDPNGYMTEQEMAVIMGQALITFGDKKSNSKTTSKYLASLKKKDVSSWAEQDMALLLELGIKNGKDLAKGNSFITKETAAAAFSKLYN